MHALVGMAVARALTVPGEPGVDVDVAIGEGLAGGAVGAFVTTLVVGAILIAVAPGFTERTMARVLEEPVGSFLYGVFALIALFLLVFLLAVTVIGIVVAVPLGLAGYLAWAVGGAIAYLAIADRLVGRADGWPKPLLVAAGISGALALSGIGGVVALCIGIVGFGTVVESVLG